jgi:hypothetical protein
MISPWRTARRRQATARVHERTWGWSGPALWAPGVSESRPRGRPARTTWTPVVGLADETSGRQIALRYTSRSLVSATAVHHRGSRWRRAGRRWGGTSLLRSRGSAQETAEPWKLSPWKEHDEGVKIIPAQNSAGVDIFGLKMRTRGSQPSISVPIFSLFTNASSDLDSCP